MQLRARRSISTCPACGTASCRVHSHYQPKLADLPWEGLPVVILLQARKFFCVGDSCRRKIFTEPLPGTVARCGRRSCRLRRSSPLADACLGYPSGPSMTLRPSWFHAYIPATLDAEGICEALTHCPCFSDDSLSASSAVWAGGDHHSESFVFRSASPPGSAASSQRRSARGSRVDAR
jgi:hypothetical protein